MNRPPRVALIIETSKEYGRGVLLGINQYVRENGPWSLYVEERGLDELDASWLVRWKGEGIISRSLDRSMALRAQRRGIAVVDVRYQALTEELPAVLADQRAIGEMAARHLLERNLTEFAFLGLSGVNWSHDRRDAFRECIAGAGGVCHVHEIVAAEHANWRTSRQALVRWAKQLPKPVGVMGSHDGLALKLLDACRHADVPVPEQMAVVGVDNDELLCEMATPRLSSVDQDVERIGYEAAAMLDRQMLSTESAAEPKIVFVPPRGVVTRQSTDTYAVEDELIHRALRYIREHAHLGISVRDVARAAGTSRRTLERRFARCLTRSPREEIERAQLDRVKQLLAETDLSLEKIASRAGYAYHEYLCSIFKQKVGATPGQYRERHRRRGRT